MLGLAKRGRFRVGQNQWKLRGQIGPSDRADRRLGELRQRRVAVLEECLGIEFDLA
jgi:hypothetical protein